MGALWSSPDEPHRRPARRSAADGRRPMSCLEFTGCVLAAVLALAGLAVLGVMVLLFTGSIRLAPNK